MRTCAALLLLISLPVWPQWSPVNDPVGRIIEALLLKDSVLYAGTNIGIYRSRDAGKSWDSTASGYSSQGFAVSGPYILARSTSHVIRTSNQGDTWQTAHAGLADTHALAILSFGGRVFLGTGQGVYASSNHGGHWMPSHEGMGDSVAYAFAAEGRWLLAFTHAGMYRSADTGKTWVPSGADLPASGGYFWQSFARSREHLFAKTKGVFRSRDSGETWHPIAGSTPDSTVFAIFDDGLDLFAGSRTGLYRSSDAGETFAKVNGDFGDEFQPVAAALRGTEIFLATTQGVFRSVDRGATWQARNKGMGTTPVQEFLSTGGDLWAAAGQWGLHRTSDRGENWTLIRSPAANSISLAAAGDTVFVGTDDGIMASWDRGTTWRAVNLGLEPGVNIVFELESGGGFLYAIINTSGGFHVYQASIARLGLGWSRCGTAPGLSQDLLLSGTTLYVASDSGLAFSTDDCRTWSPSRALPGGRGVSRVAALGRFLVTAGPDGLYRSGNGADWMRVDSIPGSNPGADSWSSLVSTSAGFFAGTQGGRIRFSGDSGATWISLSEVPRPSPLPVQAFVEHDGEVYAGMFGIFKRPLAGMGLGTRRREGTDRSAPRSRLRSALQILRELGADLLGRSTAPGAQQGL